MPRSTSMMTVTTPTVGLRLPSGRQLQSSEDPVDACPADLEPLGNLARSQSLSLKLGDLPSLNRRWAALVDPASLGSCYAPICRSRRKLVSNSAKTPNMSRKALPVGGEVSMGCSVALSFTGPKLPHDVLKVTDAAR
jgi:hypothetical protein